MIKDFDSLAMGTLAAFVISVFIAGCTATVLDARATQRMRTCIAAGMEWNSSSCTLREAAS